MHNFERGIIPSPRTPLTCPECGGVLWEVQEGSVLHYVCHVGHSYSDDSLMTGQNQELENALWAAVQAL